MRFNDVALRSNGSNNGRAFLRQNRSGEEVLDFSARGAQQLQLMIGVPPGQASRQAGLHGSALDCPEPMSSQSAMVVAKWRILPSPGLFHEQPAEATFRLIHNAIAAQGRFSQPRQQLVINDPLDLRG